MRRFIIAPTSVLQVRKLPIQTLAGLADRYYLSETPGLNNSLAFDLILKHLELKFWTNCCITSIETLLT